MTLALRKEPWIAMLAVAALAVIMGALLMGSRVLRVLTRLQTYWSMPVYEQPIEVDGEVRDVIFLHHSTGQNLIAEGNVRGLLTERGYDFWDHDYNHIGLTDPDGNLTGATFRVPGAYGRGNTDVDGLAALFAQPVTDPPVNAFSRLMQHEIIMVKSCFPNSAIRDAAMEAQFKSWYVDMRDVMDRHPDKMFIILTSPPLHPMATNPDEAARARAVASWLDSDDYRGGHANVFVFDFYDLLADPATGMLRVEYQRTPGEADSHPNQLANETVGPLLVAFIQEARDDYRASRIGAAPVEVQP